MVVVHDEDARLLVFLLKLQDGTKRGALCKVLHSFWFVVLLSGNVGFGVRRFPGNILVVNSLVA